MNGRSTFWKRAKDCIHMLLWSTLKNLARHPKIGLNPLLLRRKLKVLRPSCKHVSHPSSRTKLASHLPIGTTQVTDSHSSQRWHAYSLPFQPPELLPSVLSLLQEGLSLTFASLWKPQLLKRWYSSRVSMTFCDFPVVSTYTLVYSIPNITPQCDPNVFPWTESLSIFPEHLSWISISSCLTDTFERPVSTPLSVPEAIKEDCEKPGLTQFWAWPGGLSTGSMP